MLTLIIFLLTYAGVAAGRIPSLTLDRTGIALLGAIAMLVFGPVTLPLAIEAIDFPTILLLYALMILSVQLRLGGFYTLIALNITRFMSHPRFFLGIVMVTSAVFSAILANDIICLAFTPVLCFALLKSNLNPLPFLIGLAVSSNIGSASTIIGNPQNMLIGQMGRLNFGDFLYWCFPPSILSLAAGYGAICYIYRNGFKQDKKNLSLQTTGEWPSFNLWQSSKGLGATAILIFLFFTPIQREISALCIAGLLLCSRKMKSRQIMHMIDWHLITLFCALFIIIQGIRLEGIPIEIAEYLSEKGINLGNLYILTALSTFISNIVSNVPAVMLLIHFLDSGNPIQYYTLALSSTFAGNLITIGSIANLIVIEQARNCGIQIGFKEHLRSGIPVTLASMAILMSWTAL